jgi:hypothetical protein
MSRARFWCVVGHHLAAKHPDWPLPSFLGDDSYGVWRWAQPTGSPLYAGMVCSEGAADTDIHAYVDDVIAGVQRDAAARGLDLSRHVP